MTADRKVPEKIIDKAFEAAGGHTDHEPMSWARMNLALNAVYDDLVRNQPLVDVAAARTALERIRRIADSSSDPIAKDQINLLVEDALASLTL